jgi:hypothetical protein
MPLQCKGDGRRELLDPRRALRSDHPVPLPESLRAFVPSGTDVDAISDCAVFRAAGSETLLVRLPDGVRMLSRSRPDGPYDVATVRAVRLEEASLRLTTSAGERSLPLVSWLDRELASDFVRLPSVPMGPVSAPRPTPSSAPARPAGPPTSPPPPAPSAPPSVGGGSGPMRLTLRLLGERSQNPILAIKAVRELANIGLAQAKELVESGGTATIVGSPRLAELIGDLDRAGCRYEVTPQ